MKPYDIYIDRRLRDEFYIYFKPHKIADVLVRDLFLRYSIGVSDSVGVDSEIDNIYRLLAFSAQNGLEIGASPISISFSVPLHIYQEVGVDSNLKFSKIILNNPKISKQGIGVGETSLFRLIPFCAENEVNIKNENVDAIVARSLGYTNDSVGINASHISVSKTGKIELSGVLGLYTDALATCTKKLNVKTCVGIVCSKTSIGYASLLEYEGGFGVSACDVDFSYLKSLGKTSAEISIDTKLQSPVLIETFMEVGDAVGLSISSQMILNFTLTPKQNYCGIDADAIMHLKKPTDLYDYQDSLLDYLDSNTIQELSYNEYPM